MCLDRTFAATQQLLEILVSAQYNMDQAQSDGRASVCSSTPMRYPARWRFTLIKSECLLNQILEIANRIRAL